MKIHICKNIFKIIVHKFSYQYQSPRISWNLTWNKNIMVNISINISIFFFKVLCTIILYVSLTIHWTIWQVEIVSKTFFCRRNHKLELMTDLICLLFCVNSSIILWMISFLSSLAFIFYLCHINRIGLIIFYTFTLHVVSLYITNFPLKIS